MTRRYASRPAFRCMERRTEPASEAALPVETRSRWRSACDSRRIACALAKSCWLERSKNWPQNAVVVFLNLGDVQECQGFKLAYALYSNGRRLAGLGFPKGREVCRSKLTPRSSSSLGLMTVVQLCRALPVESARAFHRTASSSPCLPTTLGVIVRLDPDVVNWVQPVNLLCRLL